MKYLSFLLGALAASITLAQPDPETRERTRADHQQMQARLGITALRPGPSGNPDDANAANTNEATADRYPDWPDLLVTNAGEQVVLPAQWWNTRRPEIVEVFEREVVGRIPANVPGVDWQVRETDSGRLGGIAVNGQHLVGVVDNSGHPAIEVNIDMTLVLPASATPEQPVPVMIMFGGGNLQQALGKEDRFRFGPAPTREEQQLMDPHATEQLVAAGWGFAVLNPGSIQADNGAGLTAGIIGLVNEGQYRAPEDWGALRAWSWGAARALDHFETLPAIDHTRVGIEGVSRYGKAALVTLAFEPRFAVGLIGSAGEGGVSPYRRDFGEMVENITGAGEYHWMAGNFLKYGTAESAFGSMDASDLAVDAHALIALAAPRATFISYGIPEQGDALWLDQQGSWMATVAASKVWTLLGEEAAGAREHYQSTTKPPVNVGLLQGALAWRQHDGGHTDAPNWKYFIPWAERQLGLAEATPYAPFPRLDANSHAAHQALIAKQYAGDIDVYFVGDSITRRWGALDYPALEADFAATFHGYNAANFAWGGDGTEHILWRLHNGEMRGVDPAVVVIQAGTNNVGSRPGSPTKVSNIVRGIAAIVESVRHRAPDASIILTGIFPRSDLAVVDEINAINTRLASLADPLNLHYININRELADADGLLKAQYGSDGLHLSRAGYQVWAEALLPLLDQLIGPPADRDNAPPATGNPAAGF